jgi:hypothetical protein
MMHEQTLDDCHDIPSACMDKGGAAITILVIHIQVRAGEKQLYNGHCRHIEQCCLSFVITVVDMGPSFRQGLCAGPMFSCCQKYSEHPVWQRDNIEESSSLGIDWWGEDFGMMDAGWVMGSSFVLRFAG